MPTLPCVPLACTVSDHPKHLHLPNKIQQDHPQDAYPMDNMALIEMSSMHYINMPKIVSKAHSVSLKFILYCIVRGEKTPILALTECLQNQTYNVSCQNSVSHILPIYGKTKSMAEEL